MADPICSKCQLPTPAVEMKGDWCVHCCRNTIVNTPSGSVILEVDDPNVGDEAIFYEFGKDFASASDIEAPTPVCNAAPDGLPRSFAEAVSYWANKGIDCGKFPPPPRYYGDLTDTYADPYGKYTTMHDSSPLEQARSAYSKAALEHHEASVRLEAARVVLDKLLTDWKETK